MRDLNHWSKSHSDSLAPCLISFNSVTPNNSDLGFLNSKTSAVLISSRVLVVLAGVVVWNFMYQTSGRSLKVVSSWAIWASWSWSCFVFHIASQRKICCYGSCDPFLLKTDILKSSAILLGAVPPGTAWLTTIAPPPLLWLWLTLFLLLFPLV